MAFLVDGRKVADVEAFENSLVPGVREDTSGDATIWSRVKNLLWIKQNTVYKEALGDWDREIKVTGERVLRREKRIDELTNQIYNLVGFYSVFQGVILTAVTQLTQSNQSTSPSSPSAAGTPCVCTRPLCGKVWFPILLSGLAASAAVLGIALKFRDVRFVEDLLYKEKSEQSDVLNIGRLLRQRGENFRFKGLSVGEGEVKSSKAYQKAFWVIVGILVFTVVFMLSYFVILCDKWVIKGWDK